MIAPLPTNEPARLAALRQCLVLDTPPEREFDDLVILAARLLKMPIALVSLVDQSREWFKSRVGLDVEETPRADAFCAHAILQSEPLVVPDASRDPRFADNPAVTGPTAIRFYAGVPLMTDEGLPLGALCVKDYRPRELSADELQILEALALQASSQLCLRRALSFWSAARDNGSGALPAAHLPARHEVRDPLNAILGLSAALAAHPACQDPECAAMIQDILRHARSMAALTPLPAGTP